MDDHWENEVTEYGAVNITGFRLIDLSRKIVRDFMDGLRRMDPRFKGTVSVSATLIYAPSRIRLAQQITLTYCFGSGSKE